MLKEAASACILEPADLRQSASARVRTARLIEEGFTLGWLERQRGLEKLCHGLWLTSHSSPSRNTPIIAARTMTKQGLNAQSKSDGKKPFQSEVSFQGVGIASASGGA